MFNPTFLAQEGWSHPHRHGTVRDVVVSRYSEGTAVVVRPQDTSADGVLPACGSADVSQLPIIDENGRSGRPRRRKRCARRRCLPTSGDPNAVFARPVKDVMVTRLETISADAPIADLVPLFRKD